jgi:hypothetical protein
LPSDTTYGSQLCVNLTNADVLAEYQELRAVQRALNVDLTKTLSRKAIEETARRLGLWEAGRIVFEDEEEVQVLNDSAIYDYFPSGKNAVERYAARGLYESSANEHVVLEAMTKARVTLVELGALVPGVGVQARDLLFGGELLLADIGLSQTAEEGIVLATRLLDFPSFSMTTGIAQVFEPKLAALVARSFRDTMLRGVAAAALDSRTRSRIGWLLVHLASLEPEDARHQLAEMTTFDLPPSDPRRKAAGQVRAKRHEEAT